MGALDKGKSSKAKDVIAATLFPNLCDICFSPTAPMISTGLRCTVRSLTPLFMRQTYTHFDITRHILFSPILLRCITPINTRFVTTKSLEGEPDSILPYYAAYHFLCVVVASEPPSGAPKVSSLEAASCQIPIP